jgi:hypothetical protein
VITDGLFIRIIVARPSAVRHFSYSASSTAIKTEGKISNKNPYANWRSLKGAPADELTFRMQHAILDTDTVVRKLKRENSPVITTSPG